MSTRAVQITELLTGLIHPVSGEILDNHTAFFYEAGTTTPKAVYTEKEKTNPYVEYDLSAIGTAQLYAEGNYKIVIEVAAADDSGDIIYTWDNLRFEFPNYYVHSINANYNQLSEDDFLLVDTTLGAVTINMLPSATMTHPIKVRRVGGAYSIIIDPYGSETIDGSATLTIPSDAVVEIVSTGSSLISTGFKSSFSDLDNDTQIWVEKNPDEDIVRVDTAGVERVIINSSGLNVASGTLLINGDSLDATPTEIDQVCDGIVRGGNAAGDILTTDGNQTVTGNHTFQGSNNFTGSTFLPSGTQIAASATPDYGGGYTLVGYPGYTSTSMHQHQENIEIFKSLAGNYNFRLLNIGAGVCNLFVDGNMDSVGSIGGSSVTATGTVSGSTVACTTLDVNGSATFDHNGTLSITDTGNTTYELPAIIYAPNMASAGYCQVKIGAANSTYNGVDVGFYNSSTGNPLNEAQLGITGASASVRINGYGNIGLGGAPAGAGGSVATISGNTSVAGNVTASGGVTGVGMPLSATIVIDEATPFFSGTSSTYVTVAKHKIYIPANPKRIRMLVRRRQNPYNAGYGIYYRFTVTDYGSYSVTSSEVNVYGAGTTWVDDSSLIVDVSTFPAGWYDFHLEGHIYPAGSYAIQIAGYSTIWDN